MNFCRDHDNKTHNSKHTFKESLNKKMQESGWRSAAWDFAKKTFAPYIKQNIEENITLFFQLSKVEGTILINLPTPPSDRVW